MESYINNFHSINGLAGDPVSDKELQLKVTSYNEDSIEIEIKNMNYWRQCMFKLKLLLAFFTIYAIYSSLISGNKYGDLNITDIGFLMGLLYLLWSTVQLVSREKVLFCSEFALQIVTERFLGRKSSLFIPANNIFDVVINEVIQDLSVNYILIVRTKGSVFLTTPIIPIFTALKPRVDCLEIVYKHLSRIVEKRFLVSVSS